MDHNQSLTKKVINYFNPPRDLTPVNGLQGLRWLRYDLPAGFALSFVALVFALTIASLSHAPLMAGIMSAIIGTWVACLRGGSHLGVCGAAAALSYFIAKLVDGLGHGDPTLGFMLTLPIVFFIGVVLYIAGRLGLAKYASVASHGVSESMMAWIGFSLAVGVIVIFYGIPFVEKHSWDPLGLNIELLKIDATAWSIFIEASHRFAEANSKVLFIGVSTLVFLVFMLWLGKDRSKQSDGTPERTIVKISRFCKMVYSVLPAQAIAAMYALLMSYLLKLDPQFCVQLPNNPFSQGFELPHFGAFIDAMSQSDNLDTIIRFGGSLLLVDALEATLTARGIDAKDPYRRRSDLNQTLRTIGIANMLGACFHSLTHIWGGLKSTLNTVLGAKTLWAGAVSGTLVAMYVALPVTREVINHLPRSGLGAIIAVTAGSLCWPTVWNKFRKMGEQEFAVFTTGFAVSAVHGEIIHGVIAAFLLEVILRIYGACIAYRRDLDPHPGVFNVAVNLFRNPIGQTELIDEVLHVHLKRPLVGSNMHFFHDAVEGAQNIVIHRGNAIYVDSAANAELDSLKVRLGGGVCIKSLDELRPVNDHPHATRIYCRRNTDTGDVHPSRRSSDNTTLSVQ